MTWFREDEKSYRVFFNRDEKRTRSEAEPPRRFEREGISYVAPIDPDAGGTWILTNVFGVTLALLNRWHESTDFMPQRSRGLLLLDCASVTSVAELIGKMESIKFQLYAPFTLVGIDQKEAKRIDWTGEAPLIQEAGVPITSSSFDFENVRAQRLKRAGRLKLLEQQATLQTFRDFHECPNELHDAYSVNMCRPDAQTWSISEICVQEHQVQWRYQACSPNHKELPAQYFNEWFLKS